MSVDPQLIQYAQRVGLLEDFDGAPFPDEVQAAFATRLMSYHLLYSHTERGLLDSIVKECSALLNEAYDKPRPLIYWPKVGVDAHSRDAAYIEFIVQLATVVSMYELGFAGKPLDDKKLEKVKERTLEQLQKCADFIRPSREAQGDPR